LSYKYKNNYHKMNDNYFSVKKQEINNNEIFNDSIKNIELKVKNINESVTNINSELTDINESVTNINSELTDINESIKHINSELVDINKSIKNIENELKDIKIQSKLDIDNLWNKIDSRFKLENTRLEELECKLRKTNFENSIISQYNMIKHTIKF